MNEMTPEQVGDLEYWVDRLLIMLDDSPGTAEFLAERFGPVAWCIDHLREIRFEVRLCPFHGIPDCSPLLNGCSLLEGR